MGYPLYGITPPAPLEPYGPHPPVEDGHYLYGFLDIGCHKRWWGTPPGKKFLRDPFLREGFPQIFNYEYGLAYYGEGPALALYAYGSEVRVFRFEGYGVAFPEKPFYRRLAVEDGDDYVAVKNLGAWFYDNVVAVLYAGPPHALPFHLQQERVPAVKEPLIKGYVPGDVLNRQMRLSGADPAGYGYRDRAPYSRAE